MVDFLFGDVVIDEVSWDKTMKSDVAASIVREAIERYETAEWSADELKDSLETIGAHHELKLGKAQAPVRVAVTGRTVGPPLFESLEALGRDETLRRLRAVLDRIGG